MSSAAFPHSQPQSRLERRVASAAEALLARSRSVSPIEVLAAIGWLPQSMVDGWRRGRVGCLEDVAPVQADKLAAAMEHLRGWTAEKGLTPSEVDYVAATRDRRPLRFTADGDQEIERAWRTHWMRPDLSETARERTVRRQSRAPDLVVIEPLNEWTCTGCGGSGWLLFMEDPGPVCMDCADMGHLVFLPAGNAALSRRAKQASRLSAVVVRFSRTRKRYERQGILVEEAALEQAEAQCLADEDARARRRERDRERRAGQDVALQAHLAAAEPLRRLQAFTKWVGPGRKLTQTGRITLADARELVGLLGTGDVIDPKIGDRVFRTTSSEELRGTSAVRRLQGLR